MSPERIYRLLLRAYPLSFRAEYEREMVLLFRDQCRESDVRTVGFWVAVIGDVARSAPALRVEAWRESTRTMEVVMKLAAMVTAVVGVLGILNAGVDAGAAYAGSIGGLHTLSLVLGVFASVLLLAAGYAILRSTEQGRQAAMLALFTSLALVVASRLLHPWMSPFSLLVGIGFPAAFLIALYWPRLALRSGAA